MEEELAYLLKQGAHTIKDLVRLTGRTDSGIRKAVVKIEGVVEGTNAEGKKTYALPPKKGAAEPQDEPKTKPTTAQPTVVSPAQPEDESKGKRGRKATFAGKKLFHIGPHDAAKVPYNPRRLHSHGWRSLNIISDNPGITTEEFVQKGGRLNDLRWDVAHGNVKAE